MEREKYLEKILFFLVISSHIAGFIGLSISLTRNIFLFLVPFHLILNAGILLFYFNDKSIKFKFITFLIFIAGFLIEYFGVHTGKIFGQYKYGSALGFKVLDIPLLIGLNWVMLCITTLSVSEIYFKNKFLKIIIASLLMVGLDFWIEKICHSLNFWFWADNFVPFQNFIAWFLFSLFICCLLEVFITMKFKKIALVIYTSQISFFVLLKVFIF